MPVSSLNTSAINAINKSSMKPWSGATANCHLRGSGERNGKQRRKKVSFGRTMMRELELEQLVKRYILVGSNVEQWRNQAHIAVIELRLSEAIGQIVSQSVEKSV